MTPKPLLSLCLALALAAARLAQPAAAQDAPDQILLSPEERAGWSAIGRIDYGGTSGTSVCTGTLVAADLVLTAAHCVRHRKAQKPIPVAAIRFIPGYLKDRPQMIRQVRELIFAEDLTPGLQGLGADLALIVLDEAVPADVATPLALVRTAESGRRFTMVGYRRDLPDAPRRDDNCHLVELEGRIMGLTCAVTSGNSGSPLLIATDTGWQIAGVAVSRSRTAGLIGSLAVVPDAAMLDRIDAD